LARTWCVTVVRGTTYITTFSHHVATCECSVYNTGTGYWIAKTAHELAESRPSSSSYSSASTPLPPVKIVGCGDRAVGYPLTFLQYPTLYSSVTRTSHRALNPSRVPVKNIERSSRCQYTQRARGRGVRAMRVLIYARAGAHRAHPAREIRLVHWHPSRIWLDF